MKNRYQCRYSKAHSFEKDSLREVVICPKCHHFADKVNKDKIAEVNPEITVNDNEDDFILTDSSDKVINLKNEYTSSNDDFSGRGGESGGGGSSGYW